MTASAAVARRARAGASLARFRRLAYASAISLYVIVVSGATVRLTASGLGCESWPGCQAGSFFPESDHHAYVEFGNRVVSLFPIVLTFVVALAARRQTQLPRWVRWVALGTFVGTIAQAPLGFVTIYFDLHPLLVLSHFLLALVVLAGGTVVALEAWRGSRDAVGAADVPWLRPGGLAVAAAALVLVVSGTLATAAGPHSGGADIRRLGNLVDAVELHVRATAVFGVLFLALFVYLARLRHQQPLLFRGALVLLGLLLVQMVVGEVQWRTQLPWGVVLVHVALAAAVWAVTVALVYAIWRLAAPGPSREPQPRPVEASRLH